MPALPNADQAVIAPDKLTLYLLAADHPEGWSKAAFFLGCGFSPSEPGVFAAALRDHARAEVSASRASPYGVKYVIDAPFSAPDGRTRWMRSVWIVHHGGTIPHFVTARPVEAPGGAG